MSNTETGILIIGGGVIGLSIAWHLSRSNRSVTVIDSREPGQASQAAAGMLAPLAEASAPGPFLNLALDSLCHYPSFVEALRDESGLNLEICGPGMLRVAKTLEEETALEQALNWQAALGLPLRLLTGSEVRLLEPAASETIRAALHSPAERHLEPRLLLAALSAACRSRGVRLISGKVTDLETASERVAGVQTAQGRFSCQTIVIAGGGMERISGPRARRKYPGQTAARSNTGSWVF